jgi:hypothetical protein
MGPVPVMLVGMEIVAIDIRISGLDRVDMLPDPIGWIVLASALGRLAHRDRWFGVAATVSLAGVLVGIPETVTDQPGEFVEAASIVAQTAVFFIVCAGMMGALLDRPDVVRRFDTIRWSDLATCVVLLGAEFLGLIGGLVVAPIAALVTVGIAIWFVIEVYAVRNHPGLSGARVATVS